MVMKKPSYLTDKEWAFVLEYPVDWNATRAAIAAGYSEKSAATIASENLRKPHIKEALAHIYDELAMSLGEVFMRLAKEARDAETSADRRQALALIGKSHAAFTDKSVVDTEIKITVVNEGE